MNKTCLACLAPLVNLENELHVKCRRSLFGSSKVALKLPFSRVQIIIEATQKALRMSLGGAQPKALVAIKKGELAIVESNGLFILKPSTEGHPHISENEHYCMNVVRSFSLPVPPFCLIKLEGNEYAYLIKRFDREKEKKIHVEDFASVLSQKSSEKYEKSYLAVAVALSKHSRDYGLERYRLFQLIILSYVMGNNDLHLKNFSLIDQTSHYELSPCYDFVCSKYYYPSAPEMAIELMPDYLGGLETTGYYQRADFELLAKELKLTTAQTNKSFEKLLDHKTKIFGLLNSSFIPKVEQEKIKEIIENGYQRMFGRMT